MKYCPNPDCAGLEKFRIISEYEDTATACADCGAVLSAGPAPDPAALDGRSAPEPNLELVTLTAVRDERQLVLLESELEAGGIPYLAKGKHIQDLFGFGRLVRVNPITGPVEIVVRADDLAAARAILAGIDN